MGLNEKGTGLDTGSLNAAPPTREAARATCLFAATHVLRHANGDRQVLSDLLEMLGEKEYESRDSEFYRREREKERQRKRVYKRALTAEQRAEKKRSDRERVRLKREAERAAKEGTPNA